MIDDEDESNKEDPTLPSVAPYRPKSQPVPKGVRKLSGTMMLRFAESLKKLDEPAKRLDEVRQKAREILTPEEQASAYPRQITLVDLDELENPDDHGNVPESER